MGLAALHEVETMEFHVSCVKTNGPVYGNLLDETEQSPVHACSKDIEILDYFTYLNNLIRYNVGS